MHWSLWMVLGLVLVTAEMFLPVELWFLFLGASALVTGLVAFLFPETLLWHELVLAAVLALVFLFSFRPRLLKRLHGNGKQFPEDILGVEVLISADIDAGELGRGELRGTTWTVRNETDAVLVAGQRRRVTARDGLILVVGS
ncbi:MAG: NfeD family protein [Bdellovibrionales bacterium]|nr:NfeD family protein [Bdellovibrionales bacterium]